MYLEPSLSVKGKNVPISNLLGDHGKPMFVSKCGVHHAHLTNKKWKPCAREVHAQLFQDSSERTDAHSYLGLRRAFAEEAQPRTYGEFFFFFFAKRGLFSHSSEMMRETSLVLFFLPLLSTCKKMKHISICFTVN